jgi:hypothetical protein
VRAIYRSRLASEPGRTRTFTGLGVVFDVIIGVGLLATGIATSTLWYLTNAAYYLALGVVRLYLFHNLLDAQSTDTTNATEATDATHDAPSVTATFSASHDAQMVSLQHNNQLVERRVYRRTGLLLAVTGSAYFAVSAAMFLVGPAPATYTRLLPYADVIPYATLIPYVVATMAFVKAGLAISGFVSARSSGRPVRVALRIVSLSDALVSMAVTQYALMSMVGSPDATEMSSSVGMGFAFMIAVCGLVMAIRKRPEGRNRLGVPCE